MTKLLYRDLTIKARLKNARAAEIMLHSLNAIFIGVDNQTDHYFAVPNGKLKWRQGTIENLITHYERTDESGVERTIVYRYDIDPSKAQVKALLENHTQIGLTKKKRKIYMLNNIKVHLDTLPNDEMFIEIEVSDVNNTLTHDELKHQCLQFKSQFNITDEDMVKTGYMETDLQMNG